VVWSLLTVLLYYGQYGHSQNTWRSWESGVT
jgi:hypothetical protein